MAAVAMHARSQQQHPMIALGQHSALRNTNTRALYSLQSPTSPDLPALALVCRAAGDMYSRAWGKVLQPRGRTAGKGHGLQVRVWSMKTFTGVGNHWQVSVKCKSSVSHCAAGPEVILLDKGTVCRCDFTGCALQLPQQAA
jgi:hypothetical protein